MTSRRSAGPQKDEKTGTWGFVVDLGAGPEGKRRQARRRGFATKREAQEAFDRLKVAARDGVVVEPSKLTVATYLLGTPEPNPSPGWIDSLVVSGRAPATVASYRWVMKQYLIPHLGGVRLQALQPGHFDSLYAQLLAQPLSPRTVRYVHTVIRKAISDAGRKGLVVRNVADLADPPSAKSTKAPEMAFWTPAELASFLGAMANDDLLPLWRLTGMTGMRRGEVCGLLWGDVDLDAAQLRVRRQLGVIQRKLEFRERPKSDHGRRSIDLDAETVRILRRHRAVQVERRLLVGAGWQDHDLVFCGPAGEPLHPDSVSRTFDRRTRKAGVPHIRFHDLRHSHCAHLIAAGRNPKEISRRLGHASVSFTLDRYGHLMPDAGAQAAAAVAALVDGVGG
ncbi:MAG: site-specific integrase [Actinomycetota bacterium]|nr:site-specific integrase [Actinomycetota bacterium]